MIGGVGRSAIVDIDDDGVITQAEARAAHYDHRLTATLEDDSVAVQLRNIPKAKLKPKQRLSAFMERAVMKWEHSQELWKEYAAEDKKEAARQESSKEAKEARQVAAAVAAASQEFDVWSATEQGQTQAVMQYVFFTTIAFRRSLFSVCIM